MAGAMAALVLICGIVIAVAIGGGGSERRPHPRRQHPHPACRRRRRPRVPHPLRRRPLFHLPPLRRRFRPSRRRRHHRHKHCASDRTSTSPPYATPQTSLRTCSSKSRRDPATSSSSTPPRSKGTDSGGTTCNGMASTVGPPSRTPGECRAAGSQVGPSALPVSCVPARN